MVCRQPFDPCLWLERLKGEGTPVRAGYIAGWSSPVARLAHNQKVSSSNLLPATMDRWRNIKTHTRSKGGRSPRGPTTAGENPALSTNFSIPSGTGEVAQF